MTPKLAGMVATWFGCGYFPVAPGTAGSAAALGIAILLGERAAWPPLAFVPLAVAVAIPGMLAAGAVERALKLEDPRIVVVDEVVGQWLALAGALSLNWKSYLFAFVLFRIFDIWKPPPVRRLERLPGGLGVMADDLLAGVYAALVLSLMGCFNLY
jgi:phosphatidylglycerophosphatase A